MVCNLTHIFLVDYASLVYWTSPFSISGVFDVFCHFYFIEQKFLKANGVDPDQSPRFAASYLGLQCLRRSPA